MIDEGKTDSMLRRSLVAVGAMLGASAVFVLVFTLALFAVIDRAVAPASAAAPKSEDRPAATALPGSTSLPASPGTAPKSGGRS